MSKLLLEKTILKEEPQPDNRDWFAEYQSIADNPKDLKKAKTGNATIDAINRASGKNISKDKEDFVINFVKEFASQNQLKIDEQTIKVIATKINQLANSGVKDALNFLRNPFLQFFVAYKKCGLDESQLLPVDFENLYRLHGEKIIGDANLKGTGKLGLNEMIFVEDFYKTNNYSGKLDGYSAMKYVYQVYSWAQNSSNITKLGIKNITVSTLEGFLKILKGKEITKIDSVPSNIEQNIANILVFKSDELSVNYSHTGEINIANNISDAIDFLETPSAETQNIFGSWRFKENVVLTINQDSAIYQTKTKAYTSEEFSIDSSKSNIKIKIDVEGTPINFYLRLTENGNVLKGTFSDDGNNTHKQISLPRTEYKGSSEIDKIKETPISDDLKKKFAELGLNKIKPEEAQQLIRFLIDSGRIKL